MKPLFLRQFRAMKWFLIAFAAVALVSAFSLEYSYWMVENYIYMGEMVNIYFASSMYNAAAEPTDMLFMCMLVLAAAMAFYQQYESNHQPNAQMMASFPETRGANASMQLMLGMGCVAVATLIYTAFNLGVYAIRREIIEYAIDVSPFAGGNVNYMAPSFVLTLVLRRFLIVMCVYSLAMCLAGLFGNIMFSAAFMVGIFVYYIAFLNYGWQFMDSVRYLTGWKIGSFRQPVRNLYYLEIGSAMQAGEIIRLQGAYAGMPAFVALHTVFVAALARVYICMKKRLKIEALGNIHLYRSSRMALVAFLTLWPLFLPMVGLTTWDNIGRKYNIAFPLYFIPAIIVFALSWFFLIRRPAKKNSRRGKTAIIAIALAVALSFSPGAARADYDGYAFEASRIERDEVKWDQFNRMVNLAERREADGIGNTLDEDSWIGSYDAAMVRELAKYALNGLVDFENFTNEQYVTLRIARNEMTDFSNLMIEAGMTEAAEVIRKYGSSELSGSKSFHADGYWFEIYDEDSWDSEFEENSYAWNTSKLDVGILTDFPFIVKGDSPRKVDEVFLGNERVYRSYAFSNGEYDTLRYRNRSTEIPMNAIFKDGALVSIIMSLSAFNGYKDRDEIRNSAIETAITAAAAGGGISAADEDEAEIAICDLVAKQRSGSGSAGKLSWSVRFDNLRSDTAKIMLSIDR